MAKKTQETHPSRIPTGVGPGKPEQFTVEEVAIALKAAGGIASTAAEKLGCNHSTISRYIERHPELQAVRAEVKQKVIDVAETHFMKAVAEGKQWAVERVLRTAGKARGYADMPVELSGIDGAPIMTNANITVKFVKAKNGRPA